jgi:hypothetical protein
MAALTHPACFIVEVAEQTPEQKQVSGAHAVSSEMCLGNLVLPERRSPSGTSRPHLGSKVRVKVSPGGSGYLALRQSLDEIPEMAASPP